jgi:hypothetical protein
VVKNWLLQKIEVGKLDAQREQLRAEGKYNAFEEMRGYLNPQEYCQQCGSHFWNETSRVEHYTAHPEHKPQEPPAEA